MTLQKRYTDNTPWTVTFLDVEVQAYLEDLPEDIQASFRRIVEMIKSHGLERMRGPYVKHLEGPIWEMRMSGRSGIARACYVTAIGKRVVVVHVFTKKRKDPPGARLKQRSGGQRRSNEKEIHPRGGVL